MTHAEVTPTGLELDGVPPPAGSTDPTLVVWREFGRPRDRLGLIATTYVLYAAVAVIVDLIGPHRLYGTFAFAFDAVCFVVATFQGLKMTDPHAYTAAGSTWLARWYGGRNPRRGRYRTVKLPEVRRVDSVRRAGGWGLGRTTVVRFLRADERGLFVELKALQCCPPMVAVIESALSPDRVAFADGVREQIHRHPVPGRRGVGTTVARQGQWS
jgi:hypothetical protein